MSNQNPKVSVVIPTFNRAVKVKRAIQSCINQRYEDMEIIIVDDGSTDNTKEVIESIKDDRIVYLKQENKGVSAARNTGIKNAKGKYIALLDSDDFLKIDSIKFRVYFLDKFEDYEGIIGSVLRVNENFQIPLDSFTEEDFTNNPELSFLKIGMSFSDTKEEMHKNFIEYVTKSKGAIPFTCSGSMFKKESLIKNNIFFNEEYLNSEDLDFMFNITKNLKVKFNFLSIYAYIQYDENGLTKKLKRSEHANFNDEVKRKLGINNI